MKKQDDRSAQVRMRSSITQRCSALGRIEMTSLVSTSRYWVWSPKSGIYATLESARAVLSRDPHQRPSVRHRLRCRRDPHQWPSDVGIYSWICNMNVTRVKPRLVQVQI